MIKKGSVFSFFSLVLNVVEVGKMEKDRAFFVGVLGILRVCIFSSFIFYFFNVRSSS